MRAIVIIIDGVGVGELPDAAKYGDIGSDTLGNLANSVNGLNLPSLASLGLGCVHKISGVKCPGFPSGSFGKMAEKSAGKDSTTGHWELAGLILNKPFPTYPNGFPEKVIQKFIMKTGYEILGNYAASGTEIIKELGEEHLKSDRLIIYTSADSVFQIAAHENVISLEKLYKVCQISRNILQGEHAVARVIARPFNGNSRHDFKRTIHRKDYSLKPTGKTIFRMLQEQKITTVGIGKINDLYAYDGIDISINTKSNREGMAALMNALERFSDGLIMANLVDFDMLWGHRNDSEGFKQDLEAFDIWLSEFMIKLNKEDILLITSDHGNDPTTPGTDHSREYVPLLVFGHAVKAGVNIGVRKTFADLHATLAEYFSVQQGPCGESFLGLLKK
jgi:phosphopentomutase